MKIPYIFRAKNAYFQKGEIIENNYKEHMNLSSPKSEGDFFGVQWREFQWSTVKLPGKAQRSSFLLWFDGSPLLFGFPFSFHVPFPSRPTLSSRPPFLKVSQSCSLGKRKFQYFQTFFVATKSVRRPSQEEPTCFVPPPDTAGRRTR